MSHLESSSLASALRAVGDCPQLRSPANKRGLSLSWHVFASTLRRKRLAFVCAAILAAASLLLPARQACSATYYWDTNGTTAGFGTAGGTWGSSTFWNSDPLGGAAGTFTATTTTSDSINFGTASAGLGAGTTTVGTGSAGSITFGSQSGAVVLSGGTITLGAASTITVNNATDTIGSTLAGAATSLAVNGTGTLILTSNSTAYAGPTSISNGTLDLAFSSSPSFASHITVNSGATLEVAPTAGLTIGSAATVNLQGAINYNVAANGNYQILAGLVTVNAPSTIDTTGVAGGLAGLYLDGGLAGSSALTVTGHTAGVGLSFRNNNISTYSGTMTVNGIASTAVGGGSGLVVGNRGTNATMPNANLTLNGTLEMGNTGMGSATGLTSGQTFQINALAGTGDVVSNWASGTNTTTLSVGNNNGTGGNFSGVIADGQDDKLSFTKNGTGTQILSGADTYSGTTTVSAGTLITTSASGLGAGTNNVAVSANAALDYAASTNAQLAIGGTLAITGGTSTTIGASIGSTATSAEINVTGAATATAAALTVNVYGINGVTPVAGPTTYTLVNGGGSSTLSNATSLTLGTVYNNTNFTVGALGSTTSTITASISGATALTTAFWQGGLTGATNVWSASNGATQSNWVATSGGANQPLVPGTAAAVTISNSSVTTSPNPSVLGDNMTINSLTIADTTNGLGLNADGFTLTITPSSSANGISMSANVPTSFIAANVALGAAQTWTNNSSVGALTVSGAISGAFGLTTGGAGTINLSGTNLGFTGGLTVSNGVVNITNNAASTSIAALIVGTTSSNSITPTVNVSSGNFTFNSAGAPYSDIGGNLNGARGALNISGTAVVTTASTGSGGWLMIGSSSTSGAGVITQTGGTFSANGAGNVGIITGWTGGFGDYLLSGGTMSTSSTSSFSLGQTGAGVYSQSGGSAIWASAFNMSFSGGASVADISGGTLTHIGTSAFMNTSGSSGAGTAVLAVRGTGTLTEQGGNFILAPAGTGTVNLLTGGTIVANKIQKGSGTGNINFDGGTLQAYSINGGTLFLTGLSNAIVNGGGLTVNNSGTPITVGQTLSAPAGFGIGADGSTITVSSGGSGYIAPPVVTFSAPASGVAATGVAVVSGGVVTGIIITNPGSGYTSAQSVTVTFNTGASTDNAYVTAATLTGLTASTLNTSGGLTLTGSGTTTLSAANTFTGDTIVSGGTLLLTNALALQDSPLNYNNQGGTFSFGTLTSATLGGLKGAENLPTGTVTTLTLNNQPSTSVTYSGAIANGSGALAVAESGSGTQILSGADSFTGGVLLNAGTLQLGSTGALNSTVGSENAVTFGSGSTGTLALAGNSVVIANLSTNATPGTTFVENANGFSVSNATLTVGNSTNASGTYAGTLRDGTGGGTLALTKAGTGTLILSGNSTYTGATAINNGTLNVTGSLGNTTTTVSSGATLTGSGNNSTTGVVGGNVQAAGGSAINLSSALSSTSLTLNNGLTLGAAGPSYGAGNYTTLNYTLASGSNVEALDLGPAGSPTGTLTINSGGAYVSLNATNLNGSYVLANFSSLAGAGGFSLSSTTPNVTSETVGRNSVVLSNPFGTQEILTISGAAVPIVAYWYQGAPSTVWNDVTTSATKVNWSTDLAGTMDAGNTPGIVTDVFLNANNITGTVATTLGASTTINTLNVNGNGTSTVSADGSTLTINALADTLSGGTNGTAGHAINIASTANAFTINTPIVMGSSSGGLGVNQTWTNASGNLFTVGGTVTGTATAGNTQTLALIDSAAGGTTVNGAVSDGGGGKVAVTVSNSGAGITTLGGTNTYTGATMLTAGTLSLTGTLGSSGGTAISSAATFTETSAGVIAGTSSLAVSGGTTTLGGINTYTGTTGLTAGTLNLTGTLGSGGGTAISSAAAFTESSAGVVTGTSSLAVSAGTTTLAGNNNYTGGTTLSSSGTLDLNSTTALNTSAGTFALNGGTLDNTSGVAEVLSNTDPVTLGGSFAFSTAAGTANNNLTLPGAVTITGSRTITLSSTPAATTLTFSGTATNNTNAAITTTVNGAGNTLAFGPFVLNSGAAAVADIFNGSGNINLTGAVTNGGAGPNGLTYNGTATLALSGVNTYSGATNVNGGTLQVATGGSINNAAAININGPSASNATFTIAGGSVNTSGGMDIGGVASQPGAVTISSGSLTLTGGGTELILGSDRSTNSTTATGTFTQTGGTVAVTGNVFMGNSATTGNLLSVSGGSFSASGTTYVGIFAGNTSTLTVSGTGSVTLGTLNIAYGGTGTVNLNGGTLKISAEANSAVNTPDTATLNFNGGTLQAGAGFTAPSTVSTVVKSGGAIIDTNSFNVTIPTALTNGGGGGLEKINAGTLTLSGANAYTGATTVTGGTLKLSGSGTFGSSSLLTVYGSGATAELNGVGASVSGLSDGGFSTGTITSSTGTPTLADNISGTQTYSGALTGSLALTVNGSGTQILSGSSDTYSGATTVSGGTLRLGGAGTPLPSGTALTVSGSGVFDLGGTTTAQVSSLSGAGSIYGNNTGAGNNGTLTFAGTGAASTFAGALQDNPNFFSQQLNLSVTSGSLSLTGTSSNFYTGTTRISGGTLVAGAANTLSSNSAVTLSGGTLDVSGFANTVASLTITGGTLDLGLSGDTPATLSVNGAAALGGTINVVFSGTQTQSLYTLLTATSPVTGAFTQGTVPSGYQLVENIGGDNLDLQQIPSGNSPQNAIDYWSASPPNQVQFGTANNWHVQTNNGYVGIQSNIPGTIMAANSPTSGGKFLLTDQGTSANPTQGNPLYAAILAGTNSGTYTGGMASVNMSWRARALQETDPQDGGQPAAPPLQYVGSYLISNVLNLTGLGGSGATKTYTSSSNTNYFGTAAVVENQTDPFVLQMNYNVPLLSNEGGQAKKGTIYLGWLEPADPTANGFSGPTWEKAVTGDFGSGNASDVAQNYQGSFLNFVNAVVTAEQNNNSNPFFHATAFTSGTLGSLTQAELSDILGSYGVDPSSGNHDVWAVINHNSQFAVVPEPSTLLLAALGLAGLAGYRVRRRRSDALG